MTVQIAHRAPSFHPKLHDPLDGQRTVAETYYGHGIVNGRLWVDVAGGSWCLDPAYETSLSIRDDDGRVRVEWA